MKSKQEILNQINKLNIQESLCERHLYIQMSKIDGGIQFITWQCNLAKMKTFDIKLPTMLCIRLNSNYEVNYVKLYDNFQGSQGISCSYKYLERKLRSVLIGISFMDSNCIMKNPLGFDCRHVYELVSGCIMFLKHCNQKNIEQGEVYNVTKAKVTDYGINIFDHINCFNKIVNSSIKINFDSSNLKMNVNGEVIKIKDMSFDYIIDKDINTKNTIINLPYSEGVNKVSVDLMKIISKIWKSLEQSYDVKRGFYYSNLLPSTFYGILVQSLSMILFENNFNYFQHSINGLQRKEDKPLCIGIVKNIDEGKMYFSDFCEEDLFG